MSGAFPGMCDFLPATFLLPREMPLFEKEYAARAEKSSEVRSSVCTGIVPQVM